LIGHRETEVSQGSSLTAESIVLSLAKYIEGGFFYGIKLGGQAHNGLDPAASTAGHSSAVVVEVDTRSEGCIENGCP